MMGKEKKAHEGSQSKAPTKMDGGSSASGRALASGGAPMSGAPMDSDNDGM